ncbi:hypothetical protein COLO4_32747 [Corchorus olitorius]|uniref:Uncharacterized protein n=1 Tax=Corchorus olitorius TaxID=93759 RepID=A0A1R3GY44_9ROSI|nr:hypothetical protein COLO4_32747 [Corchorus olitorius]
MKEILSVQESFFFDERVQFFPPLVSVFHWDKDEGGYAKLAWAMSWRIDSSGNFSTRLVVGEELAEVAVTVLNPSSFKVIPFLPVAY